MKEKITKKLFEILNEKHSGVDFSNITVTSNKDNAHGDFSSNVALKFAKLCQKSPLDLANEIKDNFTLENVEKVEVAGVGFLNFYVSQDQIGNVIKVIINEGEQYPVIKKEKPIKVCLEYVSANPTGYLHLGHARGAALGDAMSRILKKAGYDVLREYYINDNGNQVNNLAKSLMIRYQQALGLKKRMFEQGYHGEEIKVVAQALKDQYGDKYIEDNESNLAFFRQNGISFLLNQIVEDLKAFRVEFDNFVSETAIRESGRIEKVLERLKDHTYVLDGATFLRTTDDGDDKDRVIIKSDGSYAYICPDIAYHDYKYERGFDEIVTLLGADHHGYIARLKSAMKSLGHDPNKIIVPLVQIVRLFKDGTEFKMSKRTGNAISMKELIDEIGVDATRYFFVSRAATQHLDFDIGLAKTLGNSNPVYYAQYTHARLNSILRKGFIDFKESELTYAADLLVSEEEKSLLKLLDQFKDVINDSAKTYEPFKICNYIQELCQLVNVFYQKHRVVDINNRPLTLQRLGLVKATKICLKNALDLIAVTSPDEM